MIVDDLSGLLSRFSPRKKLKISCWGNIHHNDDYCVDAMESDNDVYLIIYNSEDDDEDLDVLKEMIALKLEITDRMNNSIRLMRKVTK